MPASALSHGPRSFLYEQGRWETTAVPSSIITSFRRVQINPFRYLGYLLRNNWKAAHHALKTSLLDLSPPTLVSDSTCVYRVLTDYMQGGNQETAF
jgi:hypothetical protein